MSYSEPTPPAALPADLIEQLQSFSPDTLREIAEFADALAEFRERENRIEQGPDGPDELPDDVDEHPEDVPGKATLTTKEIKGNQYYYWQWREGDSIKSKYHAPVNPD